ncbi:glycosyltransferase family 39 protein [Streptomyces aquilus]|uniref:glycosyltransferase family 39 protein n=1 Tax=Streptomyces aquilus TaxID=2548456 RepID=UPI00367CCB7B
MRATMVAAVRLLSLRTADDLLSAWHDPVRVQRWYRSSLTALLSLLALVMGLWKLDRDGASWRDETVSYAVGKRSLGELWHLLHHIDAVHGLYYAFAHVVLSVWDDGVISLRVVSVLATVIAALGVNAIGRRLADEATGFLSGFAFVCIPQVQFYAQEARSYALVAAAVVWATWFFVRALQEERPVWWAGYGLLLVLAGWLHEFALLVLLAHAVTLWRGGRHGTHGRRWLAVSLAAVAAVSPLAVISAGQAAAQLDWLAPPGLNDWFGYALPAAVAITLARLLRRHRGQRAAARTVSMSAVGLPLLIVPAGFLLTVSLVHPWYVDRYVLYGMAGLALLVGPALRYGLASLTAEPDPRRRHRRLKTTIAGGLAATCALTALYWQDRLPSSRTDTVESYWGLTATAPGQKEPVLFQPARRRVWILARPTVFGPLDDIALQQSPQTSGTLYGIEAAPHVIRHRMLQHPQLTVLRDRPGQPLDHTPAENTKRAVLRTYFQLCWAVPVAGGEVTTYIRRDLAPTNPLCAPGRDIYS